VTTHPRAGARAVTIAGLSTNQSFDWDFTPFNAIHPGWCGNGERLTVDGAPPT
jgi:hypothetical protein